MFLKQVLIQAMDLGKLMLISGAGVSRVEDTIERICLAYGAREVEAFTITSSIIVTVTTEDGDVFTQTKRIKYYKTDFHKLDQLNDLSRYVCREKPDISYLEEKLSEIRKEKIYSLPVQCLIASLIAGTFAVFFGGGFVEGIIGAVCGAAVWWLMAGLQKLDSNIMFSDFAAAFMVASIAYILAHMGATRDYGTIIIGNIMLLVPGVAFVNSIRDIIGGDVMAGLIRLCEVIVTAVFLAAGSFTALVLWGGIL